MDLTNNYRTPWTEGNRDTGKKTHMYIQSAGGIRIQDCSVRSVGNNTKLDREVTVKLNVN